MDGQKDILAELKGKENPFRTPEGYFETFSDRIVQRIAEEESSSSASPRRGVWRVIKPALTMAAMFAIIFGMGYGVLSLTHTLDRGAGTTEVSGYATAEEELIRSSSILEYYENGQPAEETTEIDDETIVSYLSSSLSFSELADIYAQLY